MEFFSIASLLVTAAVFGIIAKTLKQPLLVGYLFAGLFLGLAGFLPDAEAFSGLGKIGVALLLFMLGLEMKISDLGSVGKVSVVTGVGQIIFTTLLGFLLSQLLGFGLLASLYIGIALSFSSTIIMVKLLSEKKDLSSLYGRISIGFLLVQDVVAILILVFLSSLQKGSVNPQDYALLLIKVAMTFLVVWLLSKKVLPKFIDNIAEGSSELLFIVSMAWALGVASTVAGPLGFSLEIGGFIAGIALSNLPEHLQIASMVRPLRDFFLTIFFLLLGTQLVVDGGLMSIIPKSAILSAFVLFGNPLIVLTILGVLRHKKRTGFMAGLTVAQISEFSLILMAMGLTVGHVGASEVAVVVLVAVFTMTISTYLIMSSDRIYEKIKNKLTIFERPTTKEAPPVADTQLTPSVVLIGCDRTGNSLRKYFKAHKVSFVVIDFNPAVVNKLGKLNIPVVFGDANDPEILEASGVRHAKLVISTISNLSDNLNILEKINKSKPAPTTIIRASQNKDAVRLYDKGADYVLVPEMVAGEFIRHLLNAYGYGVKLNLAGKRHFSRFTSP